MKKKLMTMVMAASLALSMSLSAFAASLPEAGSEATPYKDIADLYSASCYDLTVTYYDSQITEGDDYYELPDCELSIITYYDPGLISGKKAGDSIFVEGRNRKLDDIRTIDGYKWYCFDVDYNDDDNFWALVVTDNGLIGIGEDDWVWRTCVYEGPVWFSKDAEIFTGTEHLPSTTQAYFFQPNTSRDYRYQQWGYLNDYMDGYVIDLYGNVKVDDLGYVNWYQEKYAV